MDTVGAGGASKLVPTDLDKKTAARATMADADFADDAVTAGGRWPAYQPCHFHDVVDVVSKSIAPTGDDGRPYIDRSM
jgi:hypothetical protein